MSYLDYFKFFKRGEPEEITKLNNLKYEISNIKKRLDEIDKLKEDWFAHKQRLKKKASRFVRRLKELYNKRDENEKMIKEFLKTRDSLNQVVQKLISQIKEISTRKKEAFKKYHIKYDPSYLKEQIKKLDFSIETEAYSFKEERKVMGQIKELRKRLQEASQVEGIAEQENEISKGIEEARKKADEAHENHKRLLEENKTSFNEFGELVKKINGIKKMQKEALDNFMKYKQEFTQNGNLLKGKLAELNIIKEELEKKKIAIQETEKAKEDKILEDKAQEVEEKIKAKKRLTTEDLLAYQGKK